MTTKDTGKKNKQTQREISHQIKDWAKGNDWYRIDIQTNQLRLEQAFGQAIETIIKDLDYHNQHIMSRHVFDRYGRLSEKCRLMDLICRAGCRTKEEMLDLDILTIDTVTAATKLAGMLDLVQRNFCDTDYLDKKVSNEKESRDPSALRQHSVQANVEWITFAQAAEMMAVSKPTLTRWADEGKITCNGKKTRLRKLNKVSVLLAKQELEDEAVRRDVRELREDAKKLQ